MWLVQVYAFDAYSPSVIWQRTLGFPVDPEDVSCNNQIKPVIGVTGKHPLLPATASAHECTAFANALVQKLVGLAYLTLVCDCRHTCD